MKKYFIVSFIYIFLFSCEPAIKEIVEEKYSNGSPKVVAHYKEKIKIREIEYFQNGQKGYDCEYIDTLLHGHCDLWDESGILIRSSNYKMGQSEGLTTLYDSTGIKVREIVYENGQNVLWTQFYPNGQKGWQLAGKKNKVFAWHKNGQLASEIDNVNGKAIDFYEDGKMESLGYIKEGEKDSLWQFWDSTGKIIKEVTYKKGVAVDSVLYK